MRRSRNDKAEFLKNGGFSDVNPGELIRCLVALREQNEAIPVDDNQFGPYCEVAGTGLAEATCQAIRPKLIKIGTVIERKLTLVRLHFSSAHLLQALFAHAVHCLAPP